MKPSDGSQDPTLTADAGLSDTAAATETRTEAQGDGRTPQLVAAGYEIGEVIGRGGMGEVVLARDHRIGRSVAIKRMRGAAPTTDAIERFLREAKIQARLDHPAIVPVHELGYDAEGRPYFTMKRLVGTTLQQVLDAPATTLHELLRALVDVCLAIDFAHARGVIHRDLKPANIMLGGYGEVYVLDWGVARVVGDPEIEGVADIASLDGETQVGALLGTPGYMAPEQARGEGVGPPADVYALGAILFEILTREELHPRGMAALASTLGGTDPSPAKRSPDRAIAPELDAACCAALAEDPAARPTPRALGDQIQAYLDGDRDVERRRTLAATHLATARAYLAANDPAQRGAAVHAAGRALALDPESRDAAALVTQLMVEPPKLLPPALEAQLDASDLDQVRRQGRLAALVMLVYLVFLPVVMWVGVKTWWPVIGTLGAVLSMSAVAWWMSTRRDPRIMWAVAINLAVLVMMTRFVGPFVLVPGLASISTLTFLTFPTVRRGTGLILTMTTVALAVPFVLEAIGVFGSTWALEGGALIVRPTAVSLDGTPAIVFLVSTNLAMIVSSGLFSRSLASSRRNAHRQVEIQAWHLGQLLPAQPARPPLPADSLCAR